MKRIPFVGLIALLILLLVWLNFGMRSGRLDDELDVRSYGWPMPVYTRVLYGEPPFDDAEVPCWSDWNSILIDLLTNSVAIFMAFKVAKKLAQGSLQRNPQPT